MQLQDNMLQWSFADSLEKLACGFKDFKIPLCWRPHTGEADAYHITLHVPDRRRSPAERMYSCLDLVAVLNHNESLNMCFMRCDLILGVCMKEREPFLLIYTLWISKPSISCEQFCSARSNAVWGPAGNAFRGYGSLFQSDSGV